MRALTDMADLTAAEIEARDAFESMISREAIRSRATEMAAAATRRWLAAQETLLRVREEARG